MNVFPFHDLNNFDLVHYLQDDNDKSSLFSHRLSDLGLRDYLFNLSKQQFFKDLDSAYYSVDQFNQKFTKPNYKIELSVFHVNIRSLNKNKRALCELLNFLGLHFDILVLSEIWSFNIDFYQNIFDGFSFYYELPLNSSVGGVGMFINKSLFCKERHDLHIANSQAPCVRVENLWVEVAKNKVKYIIGGVYQHPNIHVDKFSELLEMNISALSRFNIPCIIVGDINIDLLKLDVSTCVKNYLNTLLLNNFLPALFLPTRITKTSVTAIDHIYYFEGTNCKKKIILSTGNVFTDLSDHLPNFIILSATAERGVNNNFRPLVRLFNDRNKQIFKQNLSLVNWQSVLYDYDDVNMCYNSFISILINHLNNSFPLIRLSRRAYKDKKWITKGLKISSRKKYKLFK